MLILAIDTSGRQGSIALCRGDQDSFEVLQLTLLEGGTYSAQLMPQISSLLRENHLDKKALDGFAVVSGPGSFTGLRVGLATVKGLCEVLQKPLATVSMLEAVILTHGPGVSATALLDAGRGEIYFGEYRNVAEGAKQLHESMAKLDELAAGAGNLVGVYVTPDAAIARRLQEAGINTQLIAPLDAGQIGRIGMRKLLAGEVADAATVDVNYIRRSDAELFSTAKH